MREILFRGKRIDNGEWIEGLPHYNEWHNSWSIDPCKYRIDSYKVERSTIGQYTGLTDIKNKRIFEGDVVTYSDRKISHYIVQFSTNEIASCGCCFMPFSGSGFIAIKEDGSSSCYLDNSDIEIVGNIHDNPDLL